MHVRIIMYNCHTQHRTVLIIFPLILQTITTAWMMSTGGEGKQYNTMVKKHKKRNGQKRG